MSSRRSPLKLSPAPSLTDAAGSAGARAGIDAGDAPLYAPGVKNGHAAKLVVDAASVPPPPARLAAARRQRPDPSSPEFTRRLTAHFHAAKRRALASEGAARSQPSASSRNHGSLA